VKVLARSGVALLASALFAVIGVAQQSSPPPASPLRPTAGSEPGWRKNVEILSDTRGVDFNPYISKVVDSVRKNWYTLIPEVARPPELARGVTDIDFAILPDGRVSGMKLVHSSQITSLDRAAWAGITAGNPYPPLPKQFTGPFLALRFHFYYNPKKSPPEDRPKQDPAAASPQNPSRN
jgi:TonB family protein